MPDRLLYATADLIARCPCEPGERGKEVAQHALREILALSTEEKLVAGV